MNFEDIVDVDIPSRTFLLKSFRPNPKTLFDRISPVKIKCPEKFQEIIYLYRRWIEKRPNPADRWEHFEVLGPDNVFSYDKLQRILKIRADQ